MLLLSSDCRVFNGIRLSLVGGYIAIILPQIKSFGNLSVYGNPEQSHSNRVKFMAHNDSHNSPPYFLSIFSETKKRNFPFSSLAVLYRKYCKKIVLC